MFLSFQVCWSWNQWNQATSSSRDRHRHTFSVWTVQAVCGGRYSKQRKVYCKCKCLCASCPSLTAYICRPFQSHYTEADCIFRELLLADGYTRFLSSHHGSPVSLASKHSPDRHTVPFTRFLPIRNTLARESVSEQQPNNQRTINVDSDDLLGMGLNTMGSPQFSVDKWRKWNGNRYVTVSVFGYKHTFIIFIYFYFH